MPRHCYVLRVFTRGDEGGNPLGVVTDRSGLPAAKMQEIAAELGFSETIYLDWREEIPKVRIFSPVNEMPFAGHPLVGMTWVLNQLGPGGVPQLECGIGPVRIGMEGENAWVAAPLNQRVHLDAETDYVGPAEPLTVSRVEMPLPYDVVEYASIDQVAASTSPPAGKVAVYARTGPNSVHLRFFAPDVGIPEDPATGSAAVALAASLRARGEESGSIVISQGEEMGTPSTINLSWDANGARIGGTVVRDEVRWLEH